MSSNRWADQTRKDQNDKQLAEIEAHGYVELRPDPADGRAVIVDRTERGRRLLRDALEVVSDLETGYAQQVGRERFDTMKQVLAELLDGIDPAGRLDKA